MKYKFYENQKECIEKKLYMDYEKAVINVIHKDKKTERLEYLNHNLENSEKLEKYIATLDVIWRAKGIYLKQEGECADAHKQELEQTIEY